MPRVQLQQNTLTLELPTLQHLVSALRDNITTDLAIDIGYHNLNNSTVRGLRTTLSCGTLATSQKALIIGREHDGLEISNGSIDLGSCVLVVQARNVLFKNVTISGTGQAFLATNDTALMHITNGASCQLEDCILECDTLLVTRGGQVQVVASRVFAAPSLGSCALKLAGGRGSVRRRSLLQGGVMVTGPPAGSTQAPYLPGQQRQEQQLGPSREGLPQQGHNAAGGQSVNGCDPQGYKGPDVSGAIEEAGLATPGATRRARSNRSHQRWGVEVHTGGGDGSGSWLEVRSCEVRGSAVASLAAFGSASTVMLDGCGVHGDTNFGVLAGKGACVELLNCEVSGADVAAVSVSGGASFSASGGVLCGRLLGLLVERGGQAQLQGCTLQGLEAEGRPTLPLPPPPRPGMLPSFAPAVPGVAEVTGDSSVVRATRCKLGRQGSGQPRCSRGGAWIKQDGTAIAAGS
ncbi:hypothetical protein QJQ45_016579 [Haematococcus lacustris]|nr:hypothetical protein QJQ45_016579 [Haematococcus lacustris]